MALSFTLVKGSEWTAGRVRGAYYDATFTGTYPTGGEVITPRDMGLLSVLGIEVISGNAASAGLLYRFNNATSKLLVFYPTGGGAASPAALADPVVGAGAGASTVITPGQGKEIANATVLTTISIRCRIEGFQ